MIHRASLFYSTPRRAWARAVPLIVAAYAAGIGGGCGATAGDQAARVAPHPPPIPARAFAPWEQDERSPTLKGYRADAPPRVRRPKRGGAGACGGERVAVLRSVRGDVEQVRRDRGVRCTRPARALRSRRSWRCLGPAGAAWAFGRLMRGHAPDPPFYRGHAQDGGPIHGSSLRRRSSGNRAGSTRGKALMTRPTRGTTTCGRCRHEAHSGVTALVIAALAVCYPRSRVKAQPAEPLDRARPWGRRARSSSAPPKGPLRPRRVAGIDVDATRANAGGDRGRSGSFVCTRWAMTGALSPRFAATRALDESPEARYLSALIIGQIYHRNGRHERAAASYAAASAMHRTRARAVEPAARGAAAVCGDAPVERVRRAARRDRVSERGERAARARGGSVAEHVRGSGAASISHGMTST